LQKVPQGIILKKTQCNTILRVRLLIAYIQIFYHDAAALTALLKLAYNYCVHYNFLAPEHSTFTWATPLYGIQLFVPITNHHEHKENIKVQVRGVSVVRGYKIFIKS
jgi:hypothetical protein